MFSFLKNHPFAVEAHFESSLVLTFAVPKEGLTPIIPPCLELDTFQDKWAFVAVAMVQTKNLRPKGFPVFIGHNFFLIGYRIFVKYRNQKGKNLRGLYILQSLTNKKKMEILGSIFTHYNYATTDIQLKRTSQNIEISSSQSGLQVSVSTGKEEVCLPVSSPFSGWKEARRFAGPLPFTFTYKTDTDEVLIIEGVRSRWTPKPVEVINYRFPLLEKIGLPEARLANAFIIEDIPYYWKKGKTEQWTQ